MATMRAAVMRRYGPPEVIRIEEVPRPQPAAGEVRIRVHATTVNRTDCAFRIPEPFFIRPYSAMLRPRRRILGSEVAGVVDAVGTEAAGFAVGDRVFGVVGGDRFGAHAEYVCAKASGPLAPMPEGLSFEQAAAVCDGFILARTCLTWAGVREGQRVLVYGASGSIGTAGVQLARHLGAHVTAVCGTDGVEVVRALGPDEVVDHRRQDWLRTGATFDVVFDAVGKRTFRECRHLLRSPGRYVTTDLGPGYQNVPLAVLTWKLARRRVMVPIPRYTAAHVHLLRELLDAGEYRAVIDRTYPLDRVVEATRYVQSGRKLGNVVLTVA